MYSQRRDDRRGKLARKALFPLLIMLFVLVAGMLYSDSQEDREGREAYSLRLRILKLKEKLKDVEEKYERLGEEVETFSENHSKRMEKQQERLANAREEREKAAARLQQRQRRKRLLAGRIEGRETRFAALKGMARTMIGQYRQFVQQDLPFHRESRLRSADALLTESGMENVSGRELVNRLWQMLNKELAYGVDSEVYGGKEGGKTDTASGELRYLRIGRVLMAAMNEKSEELQLLVPDGKGQDGWQWRHELDGGERSALRSSFRMVEGKKAPDFVAFPVPAGVFTFTAGEEAVQ